MILDKHSVKVIRNSTRSVELEGYRRGDLRFINLDSVEVNLADATLDNTIDLWHLRLGHRNVKDIKLLVTKNMATGISLKPNDVKSFCPACCKGKSTKKPFDKSGKMEQVSRLKVCE